MDERRDADRRTHPTHADERGWEALRDALAACLTRARSAEADASRHKEALRREEAGCRRDRAELTTIYESAPIGLAVIDRDLRYLRINETLARLNGLPAADHIGRTVPQLFPQLEEFVRSITSTILATGRPVLNVEHASQMPSRPGERREWRSNWLPICQPDGAISGFLVNVSEITDRKRAEAALAANLQTQEFLVAIALRLLHPIERQELFDFVAERIYSLTEGGIVLFNEFDPAENKTLLRAIGMTSDERARAGAILGRDPLGIGFVFPEQVRAEVLPGEFARLPGGVWELTFRQMPREISEALERALGTRSVYAMACSVEHDLLGTVAILAKGEALPNKRLIEIVVTEAALALKRRRAEEALRSERNFFNTVVDTQGAILAILDRALRVVRLNRAYYELTAFATGTMTGAEFTGLMVPGSGTADRHELAALLGPWPAEEFETLLRVRDGPPRHITWRATVNRNDAGEVAYVIATGIDITERKQMEERTRYLAEHDALTDLPNRRLLLKLLNTALGVARRANRKAAVLFLDLDHFKTINDTLGHKAGDELLKEVSRRLAARLRRSDIVSRLGGDEFALLLTELTRPEQAGEVANEILRAFQPPFQLAGQELHTTASLGISLFPDDNDTPEGLLRRADLAMYEAKAQGRNTFRFYNPVVDSRARYRARIETSLRHALVHDELSLVYQPQIELRSGRMFGVEALVRWHHPELGVLYPDRFIPVAEETELIALLDDWVLEHACTEARRWLDQGARPIQMAVNISARRFESPTLVSAVRSHLAASRLDPQCLELELTEYTLMHHIDQSIERMRELVGLGISIAVDDFGTGYSSLSYLKQLPITKLKIDQSFVSDVSTDADDRAIIHAVTTLAHTLNKRVIAEGVETDEQRAFLLSSDCDEAQGYYFNRPLATGELLKLILP